MSFYDDEILRGIQAVNSITGRPPLTAREIEILILVSHGLSNEGIANLLYIEARTVERHVGSIYAHFKITPRQSSTVYLHSRVTATRFALEMLETYFQFQDAIPNNADASFSSQTPNDAPSKILHFR